MEYFGYLIRRERMKRGWSQEGLCKGICAVSYLSKIEQGKVRPAKEIVSLLAERLELKVQDAALGDLLSEGLDALFSERLDNALKARLYEAADEGAMCSADFAVLLAALRTKPADEAYEPFLSPRCLALQRALQGRYAEAICIFPCAYLYLRAGRSAYEGGRFDALELLQRAYDLAAAEGCPELMLDSRTLMGNYYSNLTDVRNMERHYAVAERLARSLNARVFLDTIAYNRAAVCLETGDYAKAYAYFSEHAQNDKMHLQKLALCCEGLGRRDEALAALDRAHEAPCEAVEEALAARMCDLVRFRLEHPDYLSNPAYGEALLGCFRDCRTKLPIGYAAFHLPWVLQWYQANRKYKQAYELIREFPLTLQIVELNSN